jgi:RND family efflux transporter MFP subunit
VSLYILAFTNLISGTAQAANDKAPLVVIGQARSADIIKQVSLTGTITSSRVARLSSQVSGQVEQLNVEVGDRVNSGDVILEIDSELEQLTLQALQATTKQAQAELTDAKRRYANARRLRKQNSISANEIDLREAEVQVDKAFLERQIAEERKQLARVERHKVKAPFSGVVSQRTTQVGEWIEPGEPIVTIVSLEDLRLEFQVPQEFYPQINQRSDVIVKLDALRGRQVPGMIKSIVPVSDPSARTFLIHVVVNDEELAITPGMSVHGTLRLHTEQQGVVVSRDALLRYPDGRITVWVINSSGEQPTVSERLVKIGNSFDGQVSITEGLEAGSQVVVEGNESLQDGQAVRIHSSE